MKIVKKALSLILCLVLVLTLFSGCSFVSTGFVVVNGMPALDSYTSCLCAMNGDTAFIYSAKSTYKEFDGDGEEDLEGYEPELERVDVMLTLLDVSTNKIINQKSYTQKEDINPKSADFKDDSTIIVNHYGSKAELFDVELNKIETTDYDEQNDTMVINSNLSNEPMYCSVGGVYECYQSEYHAYVFSADPDRAYISPKCDFENVCTCNTKTVLNYKVDRNDDNTRVNSVTFNVNDFENGKRLNSYSTDFSEQTVYDYQATGAMSDTTALIVVSKYVDKNGNGNIDESVQEATFYLWNFAADSSPADFEVKACTKDEITQMSRELAGTISDDNGIKVEFNVDAVPLYNNELTEEDKFFVKHKLDNVLQIYDDLLMVQSILKNFPEGMVSRLYNFSIYLVNYITGCSAYADNFTDEADNSSINYFVVLSSNSAADLPHELMHCFEAYVTFNSDDDPFGEAYESLNAEDFSSYYNYFSTEDNESSEYIKDFIYNDDNKDTACFISDYSTETPKEDKAEIFQLLYRFGEEPDTTDDRLEVINTYPIINKKANYICKILRQYFPEITDTPVWEKALKEL